MPLKEVICFFPVMVLKEVLQERGSFILLVVCESVRKFNILVSLSGWQRKHGKYGKYIQGLYRLEKVEHNQRRIQLKTYACHR